MKHLLSRRGLAELRRFAQPGTLLGLDYDGTLAPIRSRPEAAHLSVRTRGLLERIAQRYPTMVITGRARKDARRLLHGLRDIEIIGSHGAEGLQPPRRGLEAQVDGWRTVLERRLGARPGVLIEDKRYSLSVHFRLSRHKAEVYAAVLDAAAGLEGVRVIGGKAVVNLVPRQAPHKGTALLAAWARQRSKRAIYIGDDDTDEDVFALNRPEKLLTVRVGRRRDSAAAYYLRSRAEVDDILAILLRLGNVG